MAALETRRFGRTGMKPKSLGLGAAFLHSSPDAVEAVQRAQEQVAAKRTSYPYPA